MAWVIGFAGSTLIAGAAYWKRSLSQSGVVAAIIVGTILYALGSAAWFGTLIVFFLSSSLLSKWNHNRKLEIERRYEKTARRDAGQVAANGGIAVILCMMSNLVPNDYWWIAFVGVMASVNADTWATEVGSLSKRQPRSILTFRPLPAGTSGGITSLGTIASLAGGMFIGSSAWLLLQASSDRVEAIHSIPQLLFIGLCSGLIGSLSDSFIGAKWQMMYRCGNCGEDVEARTHCGKPTTPSRGVRWMNNDEVNAISSVLGGATALLLYTVILS